MKIRDYIFPLIFIPLGLAFLTVNILLWLYKGKNMRLLKTKMSIGCLLLSFSFFASCGTPPPKTCYKPAPPENSISIDGSMKIVPGDSIKGWILNSSFPIISYQISEDSVGKMLQTGIFSIIDTTHSNNSEDFRIAINTVIKPGQYLIKYYGQYSESDKPVFISEEFFVVAE